MKSTGQMPFLKLWAERLREVSGVEAAFTRGEIVFVVTKEHSNLDWTELVKTEDQILDQLPNFEVKVRANQGRDINELFFGWERLI